MCDWKSDWQWIASHDIWRESLEPVYMGIAQVRARPGGLPVHVVQTPGTPQLAHGL